MRNLNSNIGIDILYAISGASTGWGVAGILKDEGNLEKILDVGAIIIGGVIIGKLINYEKRRYFGNVKK